jgi:HNH endonuclease/AP2 domain
MTPAEAVTPFALVRECFDADQHVPSAIRWRTRPLEHFNAPSRRNAEHRRKSWNSKWAGKPAGAQNQHGHFVVELTFGRHKLQLLAHRIVYALTHGHWPPGEVDHKDGVEAGNGIDNLRAATHGQNAQNQKTAITNTSGFPGVCWDKGRRKWAANIRDSGRKSSVHLGRFDTAEAAFMERCDAKIRFHPFAPEHRGMTEAQAAVAERARVRRGFTAGRYMRGPRDWRRAFSQLGG